MRHEGFHGRAGFGQKPALLVIDVNVGFTDPDSPLVCDLESVVVSIRRLIEEFRRAGNPAERSRRDVASLVVAGPRPKPSMIRSMWFWKRASECGYLVGKSLRSSIVPPKPTACAIRPSAMKRSAIHAGRGSRSCASGTRPPASPPAPGSSAARRSRRRPPRAPASRREHHPGRTASDDEYVVHQNPVLWARLSSVEHDRGPAASPMLRCMLRAARSCWLLALCMSGAASADRALASAGLDQRSGVRRQHFDDYGLFAS